MSFLLVLVHWSPPYFSVFLPHGLLPGSENMPSVYLIFWSCSLNGLAESIYFIPYYSGFCPSYVPFWQLSPSGGSFTLIMKESHKYVYLTSHSLAVGDLGQNLSLSTLTLKERTCHWRCCFVVKSASIQENGIIDGFF